MYQSQYDKPPQGRIKASVVASIWAPVIKGHAQSHVLVKCLQLKSVVFLDFSQYVWQYNRYSEEFASVVVVYILNSFLNSYT